MQKRVELGGSEQASSFAKMVIDAFREMMSKEVKVMVIHTVRQEIGPIVEDLFRKVVREEIESAEERFFSANWSNANDGALSKERNLHLKFLDEVSLPVPTGEPIKAKGDTSIRVALVDKMSRDYVKNGPESSGKVEILLLDDNDHKWKPEDFSNGVIKEGDKTKPHFSKRVFVHLVDVIGIVDNAKLGHDAKWRKNFVCRLGARMENLNGVKVQEAWTEPFVVSDKRGERQRKSGIPSLSDSVCTLKNIGDARVRHLNDKDINTVEDFLLWLSINPQKLQQIASVASAKWKATVDHAQACIIDDKTVKYYKSPDIDMAVAFNLVGVLKGIIQDSHFIPYDELFEEQKNSAHNLLRSACENKKDIKSFEEEDALLSQFQLRIELDEGLSPSYLLPGPDNRSEICGDTSTLQNQFPLGPHFVVDGQCWSQSFFECDHCLETCGTDTSNLNFSDEDIMNYINHNESYQQSNGGTIHFRSANAVVLWMLRFRNQSVLYRRKGKRSMASGGIHVQKKQRTD